MDVLYINVHERVYRHTYVYIYEYMYKHKYICTYICVYIQLDITVRKGREDGTVSLQIVFICMYMDGCIFMDRKSNCIYVHVPSDFTHD
jgi:hypothetical protein